MPYPFQDPLDLSAPEFDFSLENPDFRARLQARLPKASEELSDDQLEWISAAGEMLDRTDPDTPRKSR